MLTSARILSLFLALTAAQAGLLVLGPVLADVAADFGVSTAAAGQLRAVSGFAGALAGLATASWAPAGQGPRAVAAVSVGQPVAWIVGQPVAGALGTLGWRWVWLAGPALLAAAALPLARPPADARALQLSPARATRRLRWWVAGELAAFTAWSGMLVFIATLLRVRHDVSPATAGLVLGACSAAYLPAGIWAGRLSPARRRTAVPALGAGSAALTVALAVAGGPLILTAAIFAALVATAAARTVASSVDGIDIASHPLSAMGLRSSCTQSGYLVGAALGGAALGLFGPGGVCLVAAGAFTVSAVVTATWRVSSRLGKKSGRPGVHGGTPTQPTEVVMPISPITIRPAMPADSGTLTALAQLDCRPALAGPILIAESRGRPLAAIALDDGAVAADPFRRSAGAVSLLRMQRELLAERRREGTRHLRLVPRLRVA